MRFVELNKSLLLTLDPRKAKEPIRERERERESSARE
jgi:hypothetical protein